MAGEAAGTQWVLTVWAPPLAVYVFPQYLEGVKFNSRHLGAVIRVAALALGLLAFAQSANAACASPAGNTGDIRYASNYGVMAYCSGSGNWTSMAGGVSVTVNATGGGATPAGSSADVQFNSSGALAADTGNFTYATGLLKAPNLQTGNISTTTVTATGLGTFGTALVNGGMTVTGQASITTISSTLTQLISNTTAACTPALAGAQRYNGVSNTIDYCTGTAWMSMGPSSTQPISFRVDQASAQSISDGTFTKITNLTNKYFDTNNNFASNRFTVTVPGKYLLTAQTAFDFSGAGTFFDTWLVIYKNGSTYATGARLDMASSSGSLYPTMSAIVDAQAGDYFEVYIYQHNANSASQSTIYARTGFAGVLLAPQGGGSGGGTATPAGSTGDVQFNTANALDADTGNLFWDKTNHRLGIGTNSPSDMVVISATTATSNNLLSLRNGFSTGYAQVAYYGDKRTYSAGVGNSGAPQGLANKFYVYDSVSGSARIVVDPNGNVGIANVTPTATLDVGGEVRVGNSGLSCGSTVTGAMRYTSGTMQVCDGSNWTNVGIGIPQGTISAFAATSCPSGWSEYTAARGRFLRGIDNGAGVDPAGTRAPGNSQVDALQNITAGLGAAGAVAWQGASGAFALTGSVYGNPNQASGGNLNGLSFDASRVVRTSTETRPVNVAVIFCQYQGFQSQLQTGVATLASLSDVSVVGASNGQVLTYNGSSWVASPSTGGTATPSGTTADIQFNTSNKLDADTGLFTYTKASGLLKAPTVSATALNSQYLSATTIYSSGSFSGNTAALNSVSSSSVSASTVSATMIQVGNNGQACGSAISGAMRYTSGTMQVCDGSNWTNVGIGIPQGTISAFAATSCPSGWSEYTAARGRFLRGIDNGASVDPSGTRSPGTQQADAMQNATGGFGSALMDDTNAGSAASGAFTTTLGASGFGWSANGGANTYSQNSYGFDLSRVARTSTETRPVNVAVIFCQYQGYQSQLQTGVATLASLSDVSVAGATNGQVLAYNGSSWVPSATTAGSAAQGDRITSSTFAIIANATAYASLSTNGTTWGYLGNAASFLPQLQVTNLNAGNVSTTLIQTGASSATCGATLYGTLRWNATSDTIQICNTAGWTSLSSSTVPNTTISQGEANYGAIFSGPNTLVTDSALYIDRTNHRIGVATNAPSDTLDIRPVAYTSSQDGGLRIGSTGGQWANRIALKSDGTGVPRLAFDVTADNTGGTIELLSMARTGRIGIGTIAPGASLTVVGEVQVSNSGVSCVANINGGAIRYVSGTGIQYCNGSNAWTSLGGGGGGSPAGSTGDIQYNNGGTFAADTGNLFWDAINHRLGVGTGSPTQRLEVASTGANYSTARVSNGTSSIDLAMAPTGLAQITQNGAFGLAFSTSATERMRIDESGRVAINATPAASTQFYVVTATTNVANNSAVNATATQTVTSNGSYTLQALLAGASAVVNSGVVNTTGNIQGASFSALRNSASDVGGLNALYGALISYGHNNGTSTARQTSTSVGLQISPYAQNGTQNNMYDLLLTNSFTGGTVGTHYAIYQQDTAAANVFGGSSYFSNDIYLNNGTNNVIWYGINGVAAPGAGSNGEKIQLYGTAGTAGASDYALGVEANNMWLNSGGGFKFYSASANRMNLDAAGNLNMVNGEVIAQVVSASGGQFRAIGGNYGMMIRNDGANTYFLLTNSGSQYGTWNSLRPLSFSDTTGDVTMGTNATAAAFLYSSDKRLKSDIIALTGGLAKLDALNPVSFRFTADPSKTIHLGLIAQDVQKVYPEAVKTNDKGFLALDYPSLIGPMVDMLKEMKTLVLGDHDEIARLKAANDNLARDVSSLKAESEKLKSENALLKASNDNVIHRLDAIEKRVSVSR